MKLPALFRTVARTAGTEQAALTAGAPTGTGDNGSMPGERRRPVYRCYGCHAWKPPVLVYMSNGGNYCPRCARAVHAWSGARPAGRRWDDVLNIDEGAEATTPDRLTV